MASPARVMPAPWKLAHASTIPATTGMPERSPSVVAASVDRPPTTVPAAIGGAIFAAGIPAASSTCFEGNGCPSTRLVAATPVSRIATASQVARYQHVAEAAAGSRRSSQSAAGRPARLQPRSPVAAASSAASAVDRVSCQMIAGCVARPDSSSGTNVGPWPSIPIAQTSPASSRTSSRTASAIAPHHASGSCSARPVAGSASVA
jgi:hypothetical protein